jgi:hypothetical protein
MCKVEVPATALALSLRKIRALSRPANNGDTIMRYWLSEGVEAIPVSPTHVVLLTKDAASIVIPLSLFQRLFDGIELRTCHHQTKPNDTARAEGGLQSALKARWITLANSIGLRGPKDRGSCDHHITSLVERGLLLSESDILACLTELPHISLKPTLSVVTIPTRGRRPLLSRCIRSILDDCDKGDLDIPIVVCVNAN